MKKARGPNLDKPWCYWVSETQDPEKHGGYVPSLVVEGGSGHWPMLGGNGGAPWTWGKTLAEARKVCEHVNAEHGITPERAAQIVERSMFPVKG